MIVLQITGALLTFNYNKTSVWAGVSVPAIGAALTEACDCVSPLSAYETLVASVMIATLRRRRQRQRSLGHDTTAAKITAPLRNLLSTFYTSFVFFTT